MVRLSGPVWLVKRRPTSLATLIETLFSTGSCFIGVWADKLTLSMWGRVTSGFPRRTVLRVG